MNIAQIKQFPTSIDLTGDKEIMNSYHESYFRSYQLLGKVIELLKQDTPQKVILEIIIDIQDSPEIVK